MWSSTRALAAYCVRPALDRVGLGGSDLLLIENVGSLVGADAFDLGEHARAVIFSVAAGHERASEHADLVRWADAVVVNKVDLLAGGGSTGGRSAPPSAASTQGRLRRTVDGDRPRPGPLARLAARSLPKRQPSAAEWGVSLLRDLSRGSSIRKMEELRGAVQ
jgi:hypothetical protein